MINNNQDLDFVDQICEPIEEIDSFMLDELFTGTSG